MANSKSSDGDEKEKLQPLPARRAAPGESQEDKTPALDIRQAAGNLAVQRRLTPSTERKKQREIGRAHV